MGNDLVTHDVDTTTMTDILEKLGMTSDDEFNLILWNDHVNDMGHIALALFDICKLSEQECISVMLEAHENNRATAKSGSEDEMLEMKKQLNERHIEVTIEQ